jgi:hypothetical protein
MNRVLPVVLLLASARVASAQGPADALWSLPLLPPGAAVDVVQADRQIVAGRVVSASSSGVVVQTADGVRRYPATEVAEIWKVERHSLWKPVLIGSGVGALLAVALQAGQGDCRDPTSLCATDGPVTAGDYAQAVALGAGIGAAISLIGRRRALVYSVDTIAVESVAALDRESAPPPAEWVAMAAALGTGATVTVDVPRRQFEGSVVSVDDSAITLKMDERPYLIPRDSVRRVARPPDMSRWWVLAAPVVGGMDGAVVGALFGAPYCLGRYDDDERQDRCAGTAASIGAAIGATLYTVLAWHATRSHVIYDASAATQHKPKGMVQPMLTNRSVGVRYLRRF